MPQMHISFLFAFTGNAEYAPVDAYPCLCLLALGPQAHTPQVWGPHARLKHDGDLKIVITWLPRRPSLKDQWIMQMMEIIHEPLSLWLINISS